MTSNREAVLFFGAIMCVIAAILGLGAIIHFTEPVCPAGSTATYSRGWFCAVPRLEKSHVHR